MKRLALLVALCAGVAACGKVQAKTPGPTPSLTIPDPPSRLVFPVSVDRPDPPATTVEKPPPPTTAKPAGARATPTPAATPTPTPSPTVAEPPPVLQTSTNLADLEARARDHLEKARRDLSRLKRETLAPNAQDQFDSASRYISMATDAITAKNFMYAISCADKAATLAALIK